MKYEKIDVIRLHGWNGECGTLWSLLVTSGLSHGVSKSHESLCFILALNFLPNGYRKLFIFILHILSLCHLYFILTYNTALACVTLYLFKNGLTINKREFENGQEAKNGGVGYVSKEIGWSINKVQCSNDHDKTKTPFWGKRWGVRKKRKWQ